MSERRDVELAFKAVYGSRPYTDQEDSTFDSFHFGYAAAAKTKTAKSDDSENLYTVDLHGIHICNTYFNWSNPKVGFGQMSISIHDGKVDAYLECMGPVSTKQILYAFVDELVANIKYGA
jgi:hypothetical protein